MEYCTVPRILCTRRVERQRQRAEGGALLFFALAVGGDGCSQNAPHRIGVAWEAEVGARLAGNQARSKKVTDAGESATPSQLARCGYHEYCAGKAGGTKNMEYPLPMR